MNDTSLKISCLLGLLIAVLFSGTALSRAETGKSVHSPSQNPGAPSDQAKFIPPKPYDAAVLYQELKDQCSRDYPCLFEGLKKITGFHGPKAAIEVFRGLQNDGEIDPSADIHQFAHEMGKITAERFGLHARAFLLCPTEFNYGCQHGFFQYALAQSGTTSEAASRICGSLDDSYSRKFRFYCYHGLGHGVMISAKLNLAEALKTCDTLKSPDGRDGCWQGVFMENTNAGMRRDPLAASFSKTDPLAPCNTVAERYRHECFINHAGWLMMFYENDIGKASRACLKAPVPYISVCAQSLGLMVTNTAWQPHLLPPIEKGEKDKTFEERAWNFCRRFPESQRDQCVIGGVDNIMNFSNAEITGAARFCDVVDKGFQIPCYRRIGLSLTAQLNDPNGIRKSCGSLSGPREDACLRGANLEAARHDPHRLGEAHTIDPTIPEDSKEIFNDHDALYSYVKKYGLQKTVKRLSELVPLYGDCHQPAHLSGRYAYAIFSTEAFRSAPSECHSGGLHGAIEAYFLENGADRLGKDVSVICPTELNAFFRHQCIHGIGHGLTAWSDYDVPAALGDCDRIKGMEASCYSGVFMENIARGLASHVHEKPGEEHRKPRYLSQDPQFPCTIVDEKYKGACYFYQTSRMMVLFNGDFSKIADECEKAPSPYHSACFGSMGRDVGGAYRSDPESAIAACGNVTSESGRTRCLEGAVQDTFWDPKGQDTALNFCRLLTRPSEKRACYKTVVNRAPQVIPTQKAREAFCRKVEAGYELDCLEKAKQKG